MKSEKAKVKSEKAKAERLDLIPEDHKFNCGNCSATRRQKAKVKSEKRTSPFEGGRGDDKVKVTLSVHQVVNYTQEVELYPWELECLKTEWSSDVAIENMEQVIKKRINHNQVYDRGEYLDIEIMEEPS